MGDAKKPARKSAAGKLSLKKKTSRATKPKSAPKETSNSVELVVDASSSAGPERIAKVMARRGVASRRGAEAMIAEGRVRVNGAIIDSPALNVTADDKITIDGDKMADKQGTRVWLYHKPVGKVVTEFDPEGRQTIFEDLADKGLPRVLTVGRLDINTEGLLLLTNDGGLKRVLELPQTGWLRRYRVRAYGRVTQAQLDKLKHGTEIDGIKYGSIEATFEREKGGNVWINLALREGKNREVKVVLGALGLQVNRLIRVSYGPFQLGDIKIGEVETVKSRILADQLGKRLSEEAGVDFSAPMPEPLTAHSDQPKRAMKPKDMTAPRQKRDGGRFGEDRKFDNKSSQQPSARILFDDGRAPEYFEPTDEKGRPRNEQMRAKAGGKRDDKRDDKPRGKFSDRPAGKSFSKGPRTDDRPQRGRSDDRPQRGARADDRPKGRRFDGDDDKRRTPVRRDGVAGGRDESRPSTRAGADARPGPRRRAPNHPPKTRK